MIVYVLDDLPIAWLDDCGDSYGQTTANLNGSDAEPADDEDEGVLFDDD